MELRELEEVAATERNEIAIIEYEVEAHGEEVLWLEEAVGDMEIATQLANSPRLERAIKAAYEAHKATDERLDTFRAERDRMRSRNAELQERCRLSIARKQEALQKIRLLTRPRPAPPGRSPAPGPLPQYARMAEALEYELKSTVEAVRELEINREHLDAIDLESYS